MGLSKKMQAALNEQVNKEYFSSYLYLSMAAYFEAENYPGMAGWMRMQSQEELLHAYKIFDYIHERQGNVTLEAIKKPKTSWKSPLNVFEESYQHECFISESINELVAIAQAEKDNATVNFLQWFVAEQVEEEASVDGVVQKLKRAQNAPGALFMIDRDLGARAAAAE